MRIVHARIAFLCYVVAWCCVLMPASLHAAAAPAPATGGSEVLPGDILLHLQTAPLSSLDRNADKFLFTALGHPDAYKQLHSGKPMMPGVGSNGLLMRFLPGMLGIPYGSIDPERAMHLLVCNPQKAGATRDWALLVPVFGYARMVREMKTWQVRNVVQGKNVIPAMGVIGASLFPAERPILTAAELLLKAQFQEAALRGRETSLTLAASRLFQYSLGTGLEQWLLAADLLPMLRGGGHGHSCADGQCSLDDHAHTQARSPHFSKQTETDESTALYVRQLDKRLIEIQFGARKERNYIYEMENGYVAWARSREAAAHIGETYAAVRFDSTKDETVKPHLRLLADIRKMRSLAPELLRYEVSRSRVAQKPGPFDTPMVLKILRNLPGGGLAALSQLSGQARAAWLDLYFGPGGIGMVGTVEPEPSSKLKTFLAGLPPAPGENAALLTHMPKDIPFLFWSPRMPQLEPAMRELLPRILPPLPVDAPQFARETLMGPALLATLRSMGGEGCLALVRGKQNDFQTVAMFEMADADKALEAAVTLPRFLGEGCDVLAVRTQLLMTLGREHERFRQMGEATLQKRQLVLGNRIAFMQAFRRVPYRQLAFLSLYPVDLGKGIVGESMAQMLARNFAPNLVKVFDEVHTKLADSRQPVLLSIGADKGQLKCVLSLPGSNVMEIFQFYQYVLRRMDYLHNHMARIMMGTKGLDVLQKWFLKRMGTVPVPNFQRRGK